MSKHIDAGERETILGRFDYHQPPDQATIDAHQEIRYAAKAAAAAFMGVLPASREASLALTRLQEAMMQANAAIAIHGLPEVGGDDQAG